MLLLNITANAQCDCDPVSSGTTTSGGDLQDDDQISIWTLFGAQVLSISVPVDTDLQSVNIQEVEAGSYVVKVSREGLTLFSTLFIKL